MPETVAANVKNRSHAIEVDVTVPPGEAPEGVLLAQGSVLGGFSLHLRDGCLRYVHNLYGKERHVVAARCPSGRAATGSAFRFERQDDGRGAASLEVDGAVVAEGQIPRFTVAAFSATGAGLTCGYELGPAVGDDYAAPFRVHRHHPLGHRHPQRARPGQPDGGVRADHGRAVAVGSGAARPVPAAAGPGFRLLGLASGHV